MTSKRKTNEIESDRGTDFYRIIFQNLLKVSIIHLYSMFTGEGSSGADYLIRTLPNLLIKPEFQKKRLIVSVKHTPPSGSVTIQSTIQQKNTCRCFCESTRKSSVFQSQR